MLSGDWKLNKEIFCEFLIPESCRWRPLDLFSYYLNKNPAFIQKCLQIFLMYFHILQTVINFYSLILITTHMFKFNKYILLNMKWNFAVNICNKFWIMSYFYALVKLLMAYSFSSMGFNQVSTLGLCFDL